jgi:hypothetical protein
MWCKLVYDVVLMCVAGCFQALSCTREAVIYADRRCCVNLLIDVVDCVLQDVFGHYLVQVTLSSPLIDNNV